MFSKQLVADADLSAKQIALQIISMGLPGCIALDPHVYSGMKAAGSQLPVQKPGLIVVDRLRTYGFAYVIYPSNVPATVAEPFAGREVRIYLCRGGSFSSDKLREVVSESCGLREKAHADHLLDSTEQRRQRKGRSQKASGKHPRWRRMSGAFSVFTSA